MKKLLICIILQVQGLQSLCDTLEMEDNIPSLLASPVVPSTPTPSTIDTAKNASPTTVSFVVWSRIERKKMLEENPNMASADISRQLGLRWKAVKEQKRSRKKLLKKEKNISKNDLSPAILEPNLESSISSITEKMDTNTTEKVIHIKRPLNPFMLWSQLERKRIIEKHVDMGHYETCIQLGIKWKALSKEERKPFYEEADRQRQDYKCQPKNKIKVLEMDNVSAENIFIRNEMKGKQNLKIPMPVHTAASMNVISSSTFLQKSLKNYGKTPKNKVEWHNSNNSTLDTLKNKTSCSTSIEQEKILQPITRTPTFYENCLKKIAEHKEINENSVNTKVHSTTPKKFQPYTLAVNARKKTNHIKRPMNAFMAWSQKERKIIIKEHPELHHSEISKQLGLRWKALSEEQRKHYIEEAERLKQLHMLEYPDYKYQPKKKPKDPEKKLFQALLKKTRKSNINSPKKILCRKEIGSSLLKTPIKSNIINHKKKLCRKENESSVLKTPIKNNIINRQKKIQVGKLSPVFTKIRLNVSTVSQKNLKSLLLTGENVSKVGTAKLSEDSQYVLQEYAAMARRLQSEEISAKDKSDKVNQEINSFPEITSEKKIYDKSEKTVEDLNKIEIDQGQSLVKIDQEFALDKILGDSSKIVPLSNAISDSLSVVTSNNKKYLNRHRTASTYQVHIDRSLTSGSICAIANASQDHDCLKTFDFWTGMVIHNPKMVKTKIQEDIRCLSKQYKYLEQCQPSHTEYDLPDANIPRLSELLGDNCVDFKQDFDLVL